MSRGQGKRKQPMSTFKAGVIGLVVIAVVTYLGFTKFKLPYISSVLTGQQTFQVMFANANQLRPNSYVREAGVNVGKVKKIDNVDSCPQENPCSAALVTMQLNRIGLPLHKDATFAIRPRLFLEGNFYIDVRPGSPSAPVAKSGFTFPISQGIEPVQTDQVLTSLQSDTRHNLQILLDQYGTAVTQGGPSFNRSVQYWLPAYEYSAIVNRDALGLQPHDLSTYIDKGGTVAAAVDAHPQNLENLVSDFDTTAAAFASQSAALQSAVAQLPATLEIAIPAFNSLNNALCAGTETPKPANCPPGPVPNLAKALLPGVRNTVPMISATLPLLGQLNALVQPSELQGLANDLRPTIPALTRLTEATIPLLQNQVRPASSCATNVILPWSRLSIGPKQDPHFTSANGFPTRKVFQEAVDFLPGLAGESRNFDSNGPYVRVGENVAGSLTYSLANGFFGQAAAPFEGVQPTLPPGNRRPPLAGGDAPNRPCEVNPPINDLSAPSGGPPKAVSQSITNPSSLLGGLLGGKTP